MLREYSYLLSRVVVSPLFFMFPSLTEKRTTCCSPTGVMVMVSDFHGIQVLTQDHMRFMIPHELVEAGRTMSQLSDISCGRRSIYSCLIVEWCMCVSHPQIPSFPCIHLSSLPLPHRDEWQWIRALRMRHARNVQPGFVLPPSPSPPFVAVHVFFFVSFGFCRLWLRCSPSGSM